MKHWLKPLTGILLLSLSSCKKEEEIQYRLFNCEEDADYVMVGEDTILTGDEHCPPVDLYSSSCLEDEKVGSAYVWPCQGPIGTEHDIVVEVDPPYPGKIAKATVRLQSDGRGEDEYRLTQDSANEGLYKLTLISVGSTGEKRQDVIQIKLWEEDPTASEDD